MSLRYGSRPHGSWRHTAGLILVVLMMAQGSLAAAARLVPGSAVIGATTIARQERPPESQESDQESAGADADLAAETGDLVEPQAEPAQLIDPGQLPMVSDAMTDDEQQALRLVEEILAEQQLLLSGQNFVYNAGGRRDPFRSLLLLRQRELTAPTQRPPGLAGFMLGEVGISALAQFQGRWHAMLIGLDRRSYFAEVGTALYDGRIVEINDQEIVFEQEVEDLLGARSKRQVVKRLVNEEDQ